MTQEQLKRIFENTDYVHTSGTEEELRVAEYLRSLCEEMGVSAKLESFRVPMARMKASSMR